MALPELSNVAASFFQAPGARDVGRQDLRGALLCPAPANSRLSVEDRYDGGRDRAAVRLNDVAAGHLQALVCVGERWPRMAREARPERALWPQGRRTDRHASAFPSRGVPALASVPQGQRRDRQAQKGRLDRSVVAPRERSYSGRREFSLYDGPPCAPPYATMAQLCGQSGPRIQIATGRIRDRRGHSSVLSSDVRHADGLASTSPVGAFRVLAVAGKGAT